MVCGRSADSNAMFLARTLTENGFRVRRICVLGDAREEITREIRAAAGRESFVLITGGLGPTEDDRTRGAVAEAAGLEPAVRDEALHHVRRLLERRGVEIEDRHVTQALIPGDGPIFENDIGTACGFCCRVGGSMVIAMPGVPEEMKAMFIARVLPFMRDTLRCSGTDDVMALARQINVFGPGESHVNALVCDMMAPGRNPEVGLCVESGSTAISLLAWAADREEAERLLDADEAEVRRRLGNAVFGCGGVTLASVLKDLLQQRGWHLAVAESCTGGMIGDMLVGVPGISECFLLDVVAYSNDAKISLLGVPEESIRGYGAVSAEVAEAMAAGACRISGAELGVSTTGIAGPAGAVPDKPVGLVYTGLCLQGRCYSFKHSLGEERKMIRHRAAHHALNQARLLVMNAPETGSGPQQ